LLRFESASVYADQVIERIALWAGRAPIGEGQSEDSEAWISVYHAAHANGASALS
jgi:hypothetical protein